MDAPPGGRRYIDLDGLLFDSAPSQAHTNGHVDDARNKE